MISIICSIIAIVFIISNNKILAVILLVIGGIFPIVDLYRNQAQTHYTERAWDTMTKVISEEIKNENHLEISKAIDEIQLKKGNKFSEKNTFMGHKYVDTIKKHIKNKPQDIVPKESDRELKEN